MKIQLVITDAAQPYHGRILGDNGEPVWWTENYDSTDSFLHALELVNLSSEPYEVVDERSDQSTPPPEGHITEPSPEAIDTTETPVHDPTLDSISDSPTGPIVPVEEQPVT